MGQNSLFVNAILSGLVTMEGVLTCSASERPPFLVAYLNFARLYHLSALTPGYSGLEQLLIGLISQTTGLDGPPCFLQWVFILQLTVAPSVSACAWFSSRSSQQLATPHLDFLQWTLLQEYFFRIFFYIKNILQEYLLVPVDAEDKWAAFFPIPCCHRLVSRNSSAPVRP